MDQSVFQQSESVAGKLRAKASVGKINAPPPYTLVRQVPDTVAWLRGEMTSRHGSSDTPPSHGRAGPKAPFRVAYMAAADREFEVLAYWANHYNLTPTYPVWVVNGKVKGVAQGDLRAVQELSDKLCNVLLRASPADGLLSDPRWGLWTVRKNHYGQYPQLAAIFDTSTFAEENPQVASEQMELM